MTNVFTGLKRRAINTRNEVQEINNRVNKYNENKIICYYEYMAKTHIIIKDNHLTIIENNEVIIDKTIDEESIGGCMKNYFSKVFLNGSGVDKYMLFLNNKNGCSEYASVQLNENSNKLGIIESDNTNHLTIILNQLLFLYGFNYSTNIDYIFKKVFNGKR